MSLADRAAELPEKLLAQPTADEPEYTPRVEFDGGRGTLDTGTIRGAVPTDLSPIFRECLQSAGYDPDRVRIGQKLKESHWQQRARKRVWSEQHNAYIQHHEFETVWLHCYKFETFLDDPGVAPDVAEIAKRARVERRAGTGPHWFVFQAGDLQIGKRSREGSTNEILERYFASVQAAIDEFKSLKRLGIEGIQISMPGDCIEGNQSQKGKNMWLTEQTITEQTLIFQRLLMHTVEAFAPLTERVFLDVVNGNHDQAQREPVTTYPGDGWATTAAALVDDALKLNPQALGHVQVRVPDKWRGCMTVPVGDTIVTVVHGHQWRQRGRALTWWAEQAVHNQAPGGAQVLQAGHYHTWALEGHATKTVVYSPTYDCGSDWYREVHGSESRRGGLAYLLRSGDVSRMSVV